MNQVLSAVNPSFPRSGMMPAIPGPAGMGLIAPLGEAIKVLIADVHPFVRSGIKQCINDNPGMAVVGEAGTAAEVFDFLKRSTCDVLVLDIGLPDQSGLEVLRILKKSRPALPVLILTMFPEDQFAPFCLRAGAAGFLSKSNASNHLVDAIREAARNGRGAPRAQGAPGGTPAAKPGDAPPVLPHQALSAREFQIFCHIASGKTRPAIAANLKLSPKTVSACRVRILKLMGMTGNADIVRYGLAHHLCS